MVIAWCHIMTQIAVMYESTRFSSINGVEFTTPYGFIKEKFLKKD